ncbi:MAG: aldehyde dehydrogenase (NAD+) [Natronomonas sp.]|jgi:aldehyde dehydrogenase (NAD+)
MSGMHKRHREAISRITDVVTGQHWIDGEEWSSAGDGSTVFDPSTGDPVLELEHATASDVNTAVSAAATAADEWESLGAGDRAELISEWTATIDAKRSELAEMLTVEIGRPLSFATGEVEAMQTFLEYYAAVEQGKHGTHIQRGRDNHTYTRQEPYGVVGIILPWNYPLELFA